MIIMLIVLIVLVVLLMITSAARNRLLVRSALDRFANFTSMKQEAENTSIIVPNDAVVPTNIQ
jgi:flagellar basal body-associated protein FliL